MDWIIHDYGPFSQEVMDACLKLDRYLGTFINRLDDIVGLDNVLFVLTADHGGLPLPEYLVEQGGMEEESMIPTLRKHCNGLTRSLKKD